MRLNFFHVVSIIAIFQSGFLSIFFVNNRKGIRTSNQILGAVLFIYAIYIAYAFTLSFGADDSLIKYYELFFIISQSAFLIGPLLYLYTKSVLSPDFALQPRQALHFIPFVVATLFFLVKTQYLNFQVPWESALRTSASAATVLHILTYLLVSIFKMRFKLGSLISTIDDPRIAWLRFLLLGYILIWLIQLHAFVFVDIWKLYGLCPYTDSLYFTCVFIFFNCIAYIAMVKPEIFSFSKKYQTSELKAADRELYLRKLLALMEKQKPYLEPSVTLGALADELGIPARYLSQIINESLNTNFCDFINSYRIEESKRCLAQKGRGAKNVLEIAYHVGFNSKSAFNQAFKKHTKMTPTEYRRRIA